MALDRNTRLRRGTEDFVLGRDLGKFAFQAFIIGIEVVGCLLEIAEFLLELTDMPFFALTERTLAVDSGNRSEYQSASTLAKTGISHIRCSVLRLAPALRGRQCVLLLTAAPTRS